MACLSLQTEGKCNFFKVCPMCHANWETREVFLSDPDVVLVGYQALFEDLQAGPIPFQPLLRHHYGN